MKSKEILIAIMEFTCLLGALLMGGVGRNNAIVMGALALLAIYFRVWRIYIVAAQQEGES